jgi:hypothetical protein
MTSDAIIVHNTSAFFVNKNNLSFFSQSKNSGMPHSIFCLKIIFIEYVIVRNMTIVAIGNPAVGTVIPCCILRRHDVAVCAGLRIVGQIGISLRNVKYEK